MLYSVEEMVHRSVEFSLERINSKSISNHRHQICLISTSHLHARLYMYLFKFNTYKFAYLQHCIDSFLCCNIPSAICLTYPLVLIFQRKLPKAPMHSFSSDSTPTSSITCSTKLCIVQTKNYRVLACHLIQIQFGSLKFSIPFRIVAYWLSSTPICREQNENNVTIANKD